jgi:hypothetical protein
MENLLEKLVLTEKRSALVFSIKITEYNIEKIRFERRVFQKNDKAEYVDVALPEINISGSLDDFGDKFQFLNKLNRTIVYINARYSDNRTENPYFGSLQFEGPWNGDDPSYLVVDLALEGESLKYILDFLKSGISEEKYIKCVGLRFGFTNLRIDRASDFLVADINFLQMEPRQE